MALYSKDGEYPTGLPHRIVLSDGRTRTDNTTFTAEELTDAGWIEVSDKPVVSYPQYVEWNGSDWVIQEKDLNDVKLRWKSKITEARYNRETNSHPTLDTTRESQAMINGVWSASQINPNITINFKNRDGSWTLLDANTINQVATALIDHVQACFNNEKALHEAVDSANTSSDVIAIDINSGWPDYSTPTANTEPT
jgi:hypothetical protein